MLEAGVDPNLPDEGVGPPLHVARQSRQRAVEELLRAFGARTIRAEPVDELIASADLSAGELIAGACAACHDLTKQRGEFNRQGPSLWGVVGRAKAAIQDYAYSDALKQHGGRWTYAELNNFVADPRGFVPGTMMRFRGIIERKRRAALIAYLRTLADHPQPPP
jgi:cytochrome c